MSLNHCPRCESELAADAPQGLCPACLLEQAVLKPELTSEPEETAAPTGRFVPPTVDDLSARFPQLEILELLGQGGMGAVYKARQQMLDRVVALKILPLEISRDPAFAERFTREARALAKLTHPNIVTVFEFGEADGLYYLMMEYVDGVNLRETIRSGSLAPSAALAVISQICDALQYAHEEGIVHRDIKPENVLLDKRGRVKIADFGLAKLLGLSPIEVTLTATHQVMGTLHYMAPEQLERPLEVDHRADIYSLGVVFYELLTGELPLGRYELPSEKRQVDARLDDVVLKTLEREPKQRYQHASEVKIDVDQISSSKLESPVASRSPRSAGAGRLPTVPFALSKNGMPLGHGVMRLIADAVALEFEVPERTTMHPFYAKFKAGLHDVTIRLADISSIRFEQGWFSGKVQIQTDSIRIASNVPGADSGRVSLVIASQDFETAEQFVRGIGSNISGAANALAQPTASTRSTALHPGRLGLGILMVCLGIGMFVIGVATSNHGYLWTGIGIVIGGGGVVGSAFIRGGDKDESTRVVGPRIDRLVMAIVLATLGAALLIAGSATGQHDLIWVGFGLAMGGGGCWSGAWSEEPTKMLDDSQPEIKPPPTKPARRDVSSRAASRDGGSMKAPAIGLCVTGGIDCCILLALVGAVIFFVDNPWQGSAMPGVIVGMGSILGPARLVGGINMLLRRSRTMSILGATCAIIPCSPAWILGLPFGIWSLMVLTTAEARREFDRAAEMRAQAAIDREDYYSQS